MAQLPDGDSSNWLVAGLGALATVLGSVSGAYALMRKTKTDTTVTAQQAAQSTVQASLDAMTLVINGLTRELERKQEEIDELRVDIDRVRKTNRGLEEMNTQQGIQIERLTNVAKLLKERVEELEAQLGKRKPSIDFGGLSEC
jgi:chromosome segregation ATPase